MKTTQTKLLKPLGAALGILLCLAPAILQAQTLPDDGWTFPTSLDSWSFTDPTTWVSDTGDFPVSFSNLVAVAHEGDINSDYALLVDSTNRAWLSFSLTNDSVTNLMLSAGSLTLWVAPADWASTSTNGTGPGARAELLSAGQWTTNASIGYWGLSISADGNNLSFGAQTNSGDGATATYLTAPISWNTNEWHYIGLTWSATNSTLYLDGQLVTNGAGVTVLPSPSVTNMNIGSDSLGCSQSRCFLDDIYTFGTDLDSTNIQNIYDSQYYEFFLNPYNFETYFANENTSTEYGTNLAVSLTSISNSIASLLAINTTADTLYEIQSTTNLSQPIWNSEGFVLGSELTNWTAANVPENGRPTLFLRLRSWQDSDGSGIPDWWELQYFGTNGIDPYAGDPSGDGWNYLQDFQNGFVPGQWNTPPPPQNFSVTGDSTGTNIISTWQYGGGPVDHYEIEEGEDDFTIEVGEVDNDTFSFTDDDPSDVLVGYPERVVAVFPNGDRSPSVWKLRPLDRSAVVFRGPGGQFYLALPNVPQNLAGINFISSLSPIVGEYIDATNIVNGILQIPQDLQSEAAQESTVGFVQLVDSSGHTSDYLSLTFPLNNERGADYWNTPTNFANASAQMKENLKFLLRAAGVLWPFGYSSGLYYDPATSGLVQKPSDPGDADSPELSLARGTASTNYEYYGFHTFSPNLDYCFIDELRPVRENFIWRNFVYSPIDYTTGEDDTGVNWIPGLDNLGLSSGLDDVLWPYVEGAKYQYTGTGTESPLPLAFDSSNSGWIFIPGNVNDDGEVPSEPNEFGSSNALGSGFTNIYGLGLNSAYVDTNFVELGAVIPPGLWTFENYTDPSLQIVDYYFNSQTPFFNYTWQSGYNGPAPVLPGAPTFSTTSTSPLLFTGIGQPITVSGWAKMKIANGNTNKFGYLEQYFDFGQAYTIDTNGVATTNSAGLLSPYGDFFPTVPGPAALVTMPDIDPPYKRGTSVVNVIKLQLDVNHDGAMDLSFGGPDNTSQAHPFKFWANNNYDRNALDPDDQAHYDDDVQVADSPFTPNHPTPDFEYRDSIGTRIIPCARDLQDFARLWICGLTSNTVNSLPAGSTVTLSWGDIGNPNWANPTIDLFVAVETNGGTGYLTNANVAAAQSEISSSVYIGRVSPGQSVKLNAGTFANNWAGNYLIWCGVTNGSGALNLTIAGGSGNTLARTTAYIQIVDIKQMYERWTIGDDPSKAPLTNAIAAAEGLPDMQAFQYPYNPTTDGNKPYILYVHGWNMERWDKDRFAESAFKRLYWQGYQGRFGMFRWPTDYGFNSQSLINVMFNVHNYDNSEFQAWQSAQGLMNKLNDLNSRYPGHVYVLGHSMGNVVVGEALRLAVQDGLGQMVNTYIASQAAIPAHVYDATVTSPYLINYTHSAHGLPAPGQPQTPNIYGNRLTNNAPAVGRKISFFNVNDYALNADAWCFDQELKPDIFPLSGYYHYAGTTTDPAPWNNFEYVFANGPAPQALDIVNNPNDLHDVLAYAANPYSTALGATPNIATFDQNLSLQTVWPPDPANPINPFNEHFYHSAEFRGDCWQQWNYWNTLMFSSQFGFNISNP